jgi:vacuolar-type H+-ATPase subunit I/STV1
MQVKSIKNNTNRSFGFGDIAFDAQEDLELTRVDSKSLEVFLKDFETYYKKGFISFVIDAHRTVDFETFKDQLIENKIINNEPNLLSEDEQIDNSTVIISQEKLLKDLEELEIKDSELESSNKELHNKVEQLSNENKSLKELNNELLKKIDEDIDLKEKDKTYIQSLEKLIKYEIEDENIEAVDLKVYATLNNIDLVNKTAKNSILKVINESFNA